jgi:hypothetical protein
MTKTNRNNNIGDQNFCQLIYGVSSASEEHVLSKRERCKVESCRCLLSPYFYPPFPMLLTAFHPRLVSPWRRKQYIYRTTHCHNQEDTNLQSVHTISCLADKWDSLAMDKTWKGNQDLVENISRVSWDFKLPHRQVFRSPSSSIWRRIIW